MSGSIIDQKNKKVVKLIFFLIILLLILILVGYLGFKYLFGMNNIDAVYNAMITTSTLGLDPHERTSGEKIFTGIYSILAGIFFISLIGAIVSYIFTLYYDP